eukprot:5891224-Alexandrium_andersonii.AAC.1
MSYKSDIGFPTWASSTSIAKSHAYTSPVTAGIWSDFELLRCTRARAQQAHDHERFGVGQHGVHADLRGAPHHGRR